jgi:hypothetical protein
VIRFAHIDHMRLGSALEGLADCPDWLRRAAAEAVRAATGSLMRSVIANDCDFLFIAGRMVEPHTNAAGINHWLCEQIATLSRRGIQVLVCSDAASLGEFAIPDGVTVFARSEWVSVTTNDAGDVRFAVHTGAVDSTQASLAIRVDQAHSYASKARLSYIAVPSTCPGSREQFTSDDGILTATAGSPQAINPNETGGFGARIVVADTTRGVLKSRFEATDTIRYQELSVSVDGCDNSGTVAARLLQQADAPESTQGRTLIVDWKLESLPSEWILQGQCSEYQLLSALRRQCRSGHTGIWPRRAIVSSQMQLSKLCFASPLKSELHETIRRMPPESDDLSSRRASQLLSRTPVERYLTAGELLERASPAGATGNLT